MTELTKKYYDRLFLKITNHEVDQFDLLSLYPSIINPKHDMEVILLKKGINDYCEQQYSMMKEKGFHDEPREFGTVIALIHGELSEALEGHRKGDLENVNEELADVCLRIFDYCGQMNIDLEGAIEKKMEYNKTRPYKHGKRY